MNQRVKDWKEEFGAPGGDAVAGDRLVQGPHASHRLA